MNPIPCIGCGGLFPDTEGPTHRYMESSPGCWACFGEVLAREYSDLHYYAVHRLTVDAYALQHPGQPSPQSIRSVALHSISLCAIFEKSVELDQASQILGLAAKQKERYEWLSPPASMGAVTVADVHRATDASEHVRLVRQWAEAAWTAWAEHHGVIREWLSESWTG